MALTNCTINSQSFTKTSGSAIGSANAQLVITPNTGYTVSAANFTNNSGAISGISSITLSNSGTPNTIGNTVLVDINLDDSYVMPASNTDIVIDIDGQANQETFTRLTKWDSIAENATCYLNVVSSVYPNPIYIDLSNYGSGGTYGHSGLAFKWGFVAASGYYFETQPAYSLVSDYKDRYSVTINNTNDAEGRLIKCEFVVNYTYGDESETGSKFYFTGKAIEYYTETIEISAYTIQTTNITPIGASRIMTIYGSPGALFSLDVKNTALDSIVSIIDQAIPPIGYYNVSIDFPAVASNDQYGFVLSGDLAASFDTTGQASTFSIPQLYNINVGISLATTGTGMSVSSNILKNLTPQITLDNGYANFNNNFIISTTSSSGIRIIDSNVDINDFTNTDYLANGGTAYNISSLVFTRDSATQITASLIAEVQFTGIADVISVLDLDTYLGPNTPPVSSNVSASLSQLGIGYITLNATDADGDTVSYYIVSLPINGTLHTSVVDAGTGANPLTAPGPVSTANIFYKHTNSGTYSDSFTYKATDSLAYGNTATASLTIS